MSQNLEPHVFTSTLRFIARVIPESLKDLQPTKVCETALILPLLSLPATQNKLHMYLS